MRAATAAISASGASAGRGDSVPGTTGAPARIAAWRAPVLLPMIRIASGVGPMNVRPAWPQASREGGVLGQEAVAGMHGVGAGRGGRRRSAGRCRDSSAPARRRRAATPRPRRRHAAPRDRTARRRATLARPRSRQARATRTAISPRLAIRILLHGARTSGAYGRCDGRRHSGMFPCLRGGLRSRFVSRRASAAISRRRVVRGSITSST